MKKVINGIELYRREKSSACSKGAWNTRHFHTCWSSALGGPACWVVWETGKEIRGGFNKVSDAQLCMVGLEIQWRPEPLEMAVVAVSSNTNSFGLAGVILMARDGRTWEVGHCQHPEAWAKGQRISVSLDLQGAPIFMGCEIPRRLPDAPQPVINEVWM
jgi:hypothetical protein